MAILEGHRIDVTDETAVAQVWSTKFSRNSASGCDGQYIGGFAGGMNYGDGNQILDQMLASNLRSGYVLSRAVVAGHAQAKARSDCEHRIESCA